MQLGINLWGVIYGHRLPAHDAGAERRLHRQYLERIRVSSAIRRQGAYNISKFGVRGLTECLWSELDGTGVRAVCVHPGGIRTNIEKSGRRCAASGEEESRFSVLADKLLRTTAYDCAADIIAASSAAKARHHRQPVHHAFWLSRLLPSNYPAVLKLVAR